MKRILIAVAVVAASTAFAAPANAMTADAISYEAKLGQLCYPGEKTDTCIIRVARSAPDTIFDLAEKGLYDAGKAIGDGIDSIDDAIAKVKALCERHLSGCGTAIPV